MKTFVLALAIFCFAAVAHGAEAKFPIGERLVYDMTWMGVPIGTAELWAKEKTTLGGREVFHVVGLMETNKFLSAIYPVRNEIHSWIDAETLTSVKFEKFISEGKTSSHEVMEFTKPTQDVISIFYWARLQPLEPGKTFRAVVTVDRKEWELEAVVLKRETLEIRRWRPVPTLLVEPRGRLAGQSQKKGKSFMSFTDDPSKKPIRITYKAPFGIMAGVLAGESEKEYLR